MASEVRRRIETRLAWLGINFKDVADVLGKDRSWLSRLLAQSLPPRGSLDRLCAVLDLDPEIVLAEDMAPEVLLVSHPGVQERRVPNHAHRVRDLKTWFEQAYPEADA